MDRGKAGRAVAWLLVVAWAAVIFAMSARSGLDLDSGTGVISVVKHWLAEALSALAGEPVDPSPVGHFGEYFVFGILLVNALRYDLRSPRAIVVAVAIAAVYACTDEFHQLFVAGRSCDPADWLVDVTASLLAAAIAWLVLGERRS